MIDIIVFLVFVLALIAFSLYPAIHLCEKLSDKYDFVNRNSTKLSIILALIFSITATTFIFQF